MEEKALQKPTMVSRLPKFGARPQGSTSSLPNGAGQPLHSQEGKGGGTGVKPNGMVRLASPFSLKLKKGGGSPSPGLLCPPEGTEPQKQGEEGRLGQRPHQPAQLSTPREVKKPSAPGAKVRRSASSVTSATSRSIPQPSKLAPRGGSAQTSSGHSLSAKPGLNGATTRFGLGLQRTGSNPSTGRGAGGAGSGSGSLRDGLSQSSDSLKAPSVDNMVRSQSFTHFKQVPSPTAQPITRSFSFTRATELAKPPTSNLQRTKSLLAKPIPLRAGAVQQGRGPPTARLGGTPSALPSNLKKTLLPTCVPTKAMTLAYRLTRPSVVKQQRPLLSEKVSSDQEAGDESRDSVDTPPVTPDPPSEVESTLPSESLTMEPVVLRESEPSARYLGEVLEDMSLSSTSSLERNDTSEEYMDDFDNLGDGGSMLLYPTHDSGVLQSQPVADDNAPANQTRLCSFLTDSVDWTAIGLTGVKDASGVPFGHSEQMGSPEMDFPHGSSLDLSPSDSSGGTYMWDEEGLEPLGAATHPCGSYDSDLNSLDILNNLDNLESCDLEDDDLMLDVDLPEDGSLHSGECDAVGAMVTPVPRRSPPPLPDLLAHDQRGAPTQLGHSLSTERHAKCPAPQRVSVKDRGAAKTKTLPIVSADVAQSRSWLPPAPAPTNFRADSRSTDVPLSKLPTGCRKADGMSHFDRAERGGRQGHWRRRQQRWSGPDHFHNDNRGGAFQQFDGHLGQGPGRVGARQLQAALRNDGHSAALDDSSLSRMAEDCSSVKSQLLKLKMLLQVGDGGAIQDALESGILSPEPREDTSSAVQVEELLREVEDLREELRSKDMTIAQMTQQVLYEELREKTGTAGVSQDYLHMLLVVSASRKGPSPEGRGGPIMTRLPRPPGEYMVLVYCTPERDDKVLWDALCQGATDKACSAAAVHNSPGARGPRYIRLIEFLCAQTRKPPWQHAQISQRCRSDELAEAHFSFLIFASTNEAIAGGCKVEVGSYQGTPRVSALQHRQSESLTPPTPHHCHLPHHSPSLIPLPILSSSILATLDPQRFDHWPACYHPPVLQPSSPWPSERLTQERLAKTAPTVDPSDITMTDDRQPRDHPGPTFPPAATAGPSPGPDQLSLLLSSRLRLDDGGVSMPAAATAMGAPQSAHHSGARHKRDGEQRKPLPPSTPSERDHSDGRPRILQSLRLHKKVSVPTLSQEGATAQPATGERPAIPMPASAALLKKRQLPPPTRGLPCFSSGPQSSGPARALTMFGPSRPLGLRELENSAPRPGGLIPPSLSRLPKPKIH
ncbi:hypothetical protein JZ751_007871 [Albula glossodonta]|uniref:Serine-rich coiled-coil domain-containing protein 2-like n=1 Tax=Albula glossodonta TaxID=121402 RepID=A0A8T2P0C0_9TELE|nr:hypothetical protein JZ751_007871 [Albula glossodonta]